MKRQTKTLVATALIMVAARFGHVPASGPVATPNGAIFVDDGGRGGLPVLFVH